MCNPSKKQEEIRIFTHSGRFHADEVLAIAALCEFKYENASIERTREVNRLQAAMRLPTAQRIILDTGRVFDPAARAYDHHQHEYTGGLSSFGMVWNHEISGYISPEAHDFIAKNLVEFIDKTDNGILCYDSDTPGPERYMTVASAIISFNTPTGMSNCDDRFTEAVSFSRAVLRGMRDTADAGDTLRYTRSGDTLFAQAVYSLASPAGASRCPSHISVHDAWHHVFSWYAALEDDDYLDHLRGMRVHFSSLEPDKHVAPTCFVPVLDYRYVMSLLSPPQAFEHTVKILRYMLEDRIVRREAADVVKKAYSDKLASEDMNDGVLVLPTNCAWQSTLASIDRKRRIFYVVYPGGDRWIARGVPVTPGSFDVRVPFPSVWLGRHERELQAITGYKAAKFCHRSGFMLASRTKAGAIALAQRSLAVHRREAEADLRPPKPSFPSHGVGGALTFCMI